MISSHDEWYFVEEYIDRDRYVSSMKLFNVWDNIKRIYYNDLNQHKSIEYDERLHECKSEFVYKMPLAKLRRILIHILPNDKLNEKYTDVAMGPSALIYGIEELLDKFYFVKSEYSEKNLAYVDTFDMVTNPYDAVESNSNYTIDRFLVITMEILRSKESDRKKSKLDKLSQFADKGLDILSIVFCNNEKADIYKNKLGQIIDCPHNDLIATIEYKFISRFNEGNLIGQNLDLSKQFDFNLNPFMQPVGIGCWDQVEGCIGDKRFEVPSLQFSAEYKTVNGSKGLSYVAFDGYRKILRLDRDDRKSIYDLQQELSYHIGKYNLFEKEKSDLLERAQNCIVMDYDRKLFRNNIMMERLLGISLEKQACHLGSKVVDHNLYQVYETELMYGTTQNSNDSFYKLPILLEASKFLLPTEYNSSKHFYLTYYVEEYPNSPDVNGFNQFTDTIKSKESISIPKFIELSEYNVGEVNVKKLINRLEFTEFSWSLDVEPSGDPESQDLSHLFNIKSCSYDRSHELQLKYRLSTYASDVDKSGFKFMKLLLKNPQLIKEILQRDLSNKLNIPLLNIIDFNIIKLTELNSSMIEAKVIELSNGIMKTNLLGLTKYIDIIEALQESVLNININSHSLHECRLSSLLESRKNVLMFCQGLTTCILLKQDDVSPFLPNLKQNSSQKKMFSQDVYDSECKLELFDWARLIASEENSVLKRVQDNYHRLFGSEVEFQFRFKESDNSEAELVYFKGFTHAIDIKSLNPRGLYNSKKALVGIRYTTISEEPGSINMNLPFKLNYFNHDAFKYCQLACQLDEYCASFSICSRKNVNLIQQSDCILSTLPLTSQRIGDVEKIVRNNNNNNINNRSVNPLKYKLTTNVDSQEFVFKRDQACSIHPKDSLLSYKMGAMLRINSNITTNSTSQLEENKQPLQQIGIVTTLEDCADQDYEASQWSSQAKSNFTYCPLSSICIIEDDDMFKLTSDQRCYSYEKAHSQYYASKPYTRMSIRSDNMILSSEDPKQKTNIDNTARSIEGLSTEQCARNCNLLKSKCLAFDSCQINQTTTVCNLYSIRSKFSRNQKNSIGYLKEEKQFYDNAKKGANAPKNSLKYVSNTQCHHYFLKDVYFDIRLSQLIEQAETNREKANNLEQNLINEDQKQSDNILNNNILRSNDLKGSDLSGKTLNFVFLLIGSIIGSCGLLYGGKLSTYGLDMLQYIQTMRSERMINPRISQLGLTNDEET